jgi:hypothetical protein
MLNWRQEIGPIPSTPSRLESAESSIAFAAGLGRVRVKSLRIQTDCPKKVGLSGKLSLCLVAHLT